MKIYIQWTTDPAQDWVEIDSSQWRGLAKRPVPVGDEIIDGLSGWPFCINCQGVTFKADHYAVIDVPSGIIIASWNDDPDDWPVDEFVGQIALFEPIQPDPAIGGRMNTKQTFNVFAGVTVFNRLSQTSPVNRTLDIFDNFAPPGQIKKMSDFKGNQLSTLYANSDLIRHGINVSDMLANDHDVVRTVHGWREWII